MYNLNYTYLTELEVDTRQTFSDLSTDLLLLHNDQSSTDCTFTMKTLVSSWQDFFWKLDSNSTNKHLLNVTFTDLSIERNSSDPTKDYSGAAIDDREMMSWQELQDYYRQIDNQWVGNKTFTQMSTDITNAITALQHKFSKDHVYPVGSIVISDTDPHSGQYNHGTWTAKPQSYIAENVKGTLSLTCGYHNGKVLSHSIGNNLVSAEISAKLLDGNPTPKHSHKLKFIPESESGGGDGDSSEATGFTTYTDVKAGSNSPPYSGRYTRDHPNTANTLIVAEDASDSKHEEQSKCPSFTVSNARVNPSVSAVNFAPKPYSLAAKIWERTS